MIFDVHLDDWSEFPADQWRWRNFSPEEMACRGGTLRVNEAAMDALQTLRNHLNAPMIINSAYRSPGHNRKVGGAPRSQHLLAKAFDVSMANHDPHHFEEVARAAGFTGFGYYPRQNFMHIDIGPPRSWGTPFAERSNAFQPSEAPKETAPSGLPAAGAGVAAAGAAATSAMKALENGVPWLGVAAVLVIAAGLFVIIKRDAVSRWLREEDI